MKNKVLKTIGYIVVLQVIPPVICPGEQCQVCHAQNIDEEHCHPVDFIIQSAGSEQPRYAYDISDCFQNFILHVNLLYIRTRTSCNWCSVV